MWRLTGSEMQRRVSQGNQKRKEVMWARFYWVVVLEWEERQSMR